MARGEVYFPSEIWYRVRKWKAVHEGWDEILGMLNVEDQDLPGAMVLVNRMKRYWKPSEEAPAVELRPTPKSCLIWQPCYGSDGISISYGTKWPAEKSTCRPTSGGTSGGGSTGSKTGGALC